MTDRTKRIVSILVAAPPAAFFLMSAILKLSSNPEAVKGLTASGFGSYIQLFGVIEVVFLILFFIPKTSKIGFLFICSYLGGACSVELSHSRMPISLILLTLFWISVFIKDRNMFLPERRCQNIAE